MPLLNSIDGSVGGDPYLVANDFVPYIDAQDRVDIVYRDVARWNRMSVMSVAGSGFFSSDRTIQEYVDKVWKCLPCPVPDQSADTSNNGVPTHHADTNSNTGKAVV